MLNEVKRLTGGDFTGVNLKPPFGCYFKASPNNFERLKQICKTTDLSDNVFEEYLKKGYDYLFLDKNGVLWMNNLFTGSFSGITGGYGCDKEAVFKNNQWEII